MSDYEDWCGAKRLWLNFNIEIDVPQEGHLRDEVEFELDDKHNIIWEDAVASFDHCRHILFNFFMSTRDGAVDNGRDENAESLIDCFIRLYSVLDKFTKIIKYVFELDSHLKGFWDVGKKLQKSTNPYLKAISLVRNDFFPSDKEKDQNCEDPHLMYVETYHQPSAIRNHIIHDAFRIADPDEEIDWKKEKYASRDEVVVIKTRDLHAHTINLMQLVREVIMLASMADEYRRKHDND